MIRIVTLIKARVAGGASQFQELPMVPASGTFRTDTEDTETGLQVKSSLSARLHGATSQQRDLLLNGLVVMLGFEDGTTAYVGTDDLPVHLKISESDTLDISAEHVCGVR